MSQSNKPDKQKDRNDLIRALLGINVFSVMSLCIAIYRNPEIAPTVLPIIIICVLFIAGIIWRTSISQWLRDGMHWFISLIFIISLLITGISVFILRASLFTLASLRTPKEETSIIHVKNIDFGAGAIFNSWTDQHTHTQFITAMGKPGTFQWDIEDHGRTAHFSYMTNPRLHPTKEASSSGYLTFYDKPVDRLSYRKILFECKATDAAPNVDFGVRIAVDDPSRRGDRELCTYELSSVKSKGLIDSTWRGFAIESTDFRQKWFRPPFPNGLDANTINKVVFFVDTAKAKKCPKATLWFRYISFEP